MAKSRYPLTLSYPTDTWKVHEEIHAFITFLISSDSELEATAWYTDNITPLFESGFGSKDEVLLDPSRRMLFNFILGVDLKATSKDWFDSFLLVIPYLSDYLKVAEAEDGALTVTITTYRTALYKVLQADKNRRSELKDLSTSSPGMGKNSPQANLAPVDNKKDKSVEHDVKEYLASDQFTTLLSRIIKTSISSTPVDDLTDNVKRNESRTTDIHDSRKLSRDSEIMLWLASQPPSYKTHAYHHDGEKYIMYLANYKDSHLPPKTVNSYHSVVGVYEYIRHHAAQHNILLTPAHEVQPWRQNLSMEPPTCPYNAAITYNKDDTYAKAANALYAKMQKSLRFDDVPALESTFNATASEADGYLALYRLLQFGHPRFQTTMDEVQKPVLKTRNILYFCEEMNHWAMYQNLIKNTQKEIYLFHYVVQEIRRQYGDDYERGLNHLVAKVNFWQCQLDEHHVQTAISTSLSH